MCIERKRLQKPRVLQRHLYCAQEVRAYQVAVEHQVHVHDVVHFEDAYVSDLGRRVEEAVTLGHLKVEDVLGVGRCDCGDREVWRVDIVGQERVGDGEAQMDCV